MIRTLIVFIMSLCLAQSVWARCEGYVPQEKPQNASRDIVGADLDTILERGMSNLPRTKILHLGRLNKTANPSVLMWILHI